MTITGGDGNDTIDGGSVLMSWMVLREMTHFLAKTVMTRLMVALVPTLLMVANHDVASSRHQSDYTFASSEDGLTVTVTDRSTGDFDTVTNVETLSFDDGDIAVSHDGTGLVLICGQHRGCWFCRSDGSW